jgi:hypothetical protein
VNLLVAMSRATALVILAESTSGVIMTTIFEPRKSETAKRLAANVIRQP